MDNMIDSRGPRGAVEINEMTRRVRQSRIYNLASLMLIMWGALVFASYLARLSGAAPGRLFLGRAERGWCRGIVCDQRLRISQDRYSHLRFQDADCVRAVLRVWVSSAASVLGHFTPRQMGTFWPIYFMLLYTIAGLWFGYAFVAIGLSISALALAGYFWAAAGSILDGLCQRRRADAWRPVDAPELTWPGSTRSSTSHCGCKSWRR